MLCIDLANTAVARGKIYLAKERGTDIPQGWAADQEGNPTTDAAVAVDGLIMPMAGPKGYVIAFMMDVLAGVLTGANFGATVAGPYNPTARSGVGHLLICIDVAALGDPTEYAARAEQLVEQTRGADKAAWADEILVPGELEDRARTRHEAEGIVLADSTWDSLAALCVETDLALPTFTQVRPTPDTAKEPS